jgi:NAD(P)-dependent dehydrogenase (short-subunit alcohol dehydrogenase family)
MFSLQNKIAVITGANGVLGAAMCDYLGSQGATIVVLGRTEEKVNSLVTLLQDKKYNAFAALADVTNEEQLLKIHNFIQERFGKIDILVNAAGGNQPGATVMPTQFLGETSTDDLKKVIELNYLGTYLPIKIFLPLLITKTGSSIINISSMAASRPLTRVMGYASAKAAVDNLTKWLSVEFANKYGANIRVNAIAPGFFLTEQNRKLLTNDDASLSQRGNQIIEHTPMKRFGNPEDLFGALHWLASDASKFVTGTIVGVDGGFNAYSGV